MKRVVLLICLLGLLAGCATPPLDRQIKSQRVAVVPARFLPEADLSVYARGKEEAAGELGAKGVVGGALMGMVAPLYAGPYGIIGYPVIAPFTIAAGAVAGGVFGAAQGATHGLPAEDVQRAEALFDEAVRQGGAHGRIAEGVADRVRSSGVSAEIVKEMGPEDPELEPTYAELTGFGTVLELGLTHLAMFTWRGETPRVSLALRLRVRVVALDGGTTPGTMHLKWTGRPRTLAEWFGGAGVLEADFREGYDTLAQYVWEIFFPESPDG